MRPRMWITILLCLSCAQMAQASPPSPLQMAQASPPSPLQMAQASPPSPLQMAPASPPSPFSSDTTGATGSAASLRQVFYSNAALRGAPIEGSKHLGRPSVIRQDSGWWPAARDFIDRDFRTFAVTSEGGRSRTWDGLRVRLEPTGVSLASPESPWHWVIEGLSLSRVSGLDLPASPGIFQFHRNFAFRNLEWGQEFFENRRQGLEHLIRIDAPPAGSGELLLRLETDTNLQCQNRDLSTLEFHSDAQLELLYSDLEVRDANDRILAATLRCKSTFLEIRIDDSTADYPILVDPLLSTASWSADPTDQAEASFAHSLAGVGDVNQDGFDDAIVGAYGWSSDSYSQEGRAYFFPGGPEGLATEPTWTADPTEVEEAQFGHAVAGVGDVNHDGFMDVLIGAPGYSSTFSRQGRVYLYLGNDNGPDAEPSWQYSPSSTGAEFGSAVAGVGDVNGDSISDLAVGAPNYTTSSYTDEGRVFLFYGVEGGAFPSTPDWWADPSNTRDGHFGISIAGAGDVDGDGYSDLLVGAEGWGSTVPEEGRAYLYLGSSSGPAATADWTADPSNTMDAHFGASVSSAGDVNGDGFADVMIGAPADGASRSGRSYLFMGGTAGLAESSLWIGDPGTNSSARYGTSVAGLGDVNGDGYGDILIGAPGWSDSGFSLEGRAFLYLGTKTGLPSKADQGFSLAGQTNALVGTAVAAAGDVNGDGFMDALIGAPQYSTADGAEGRAYLLLGTALGPDTSPSASLEPTNQDGAGFGTSAATVGDVNGDGYDDILVGAPGWSSSSYTREGAAFLFLGSSSGVQTSAAWQVDPTNQVESRFGFSVAEAGDVNGDGYADMLVGAYQATGSSVQEGKAYLYLGSSDPSTTPAWTAEPANRVSTRFGYSVSGAGDVNGDGFEDVLIGCPYCGSDLQGGAYLYLGSPEGLADSPSWSVTPSTGRSSFGYSVSSAGDVNGDGYADVSIGAPDFAENGVSGEGRAYLYLGSPDGPSSEPDWFDNPTAQESANFGLSLSYAGDTDGDGFEDLLVGAPGASGDYSYEGAAYLYFGSPDGLAESAEWIAAPANVTTAHFGEAVRGIGDVNGDGYADLAAVAPKWLKADTENPGRAYIFLGSSIGPSSSPDWTLDSDAQPLVSVGPSLGGGGDLNGDAFGDFLLGDAEYQDITYGEEGRLQTFSGGDQERGIIRNINILREDGATRVGPGSRIPSPSVVLTATLLPPSPRGSKVCLEVEVKPIGQAFDGSDLVRGDPTYVLASTLVSATIDDLDDNVRYHARGRIVDVSDGFRSRWLRYGNQLESRADFWYHFVDADGDGLDDLEDNCIDDPNPEQADEDSDGVGDECDVCPGDPNNDPDEDGICYVDDNCPDDGNSDQEDSDEDGIGDACDACPFDEANDPDEDGVCDDVDNCTGVANPDQEDADEDGLGDLCDLCGSDSANDEDQDGFCADEDNCPDVGNAGQEDVDEDGMGDACDPCPNDETNDSDEDGLCADQDNCPNKYNPDQENSDSDAAGDECDPCPLDEADDSDGDGLCADQDNCPEIANEDQVDSDLDDLGNACDTCVLDPDNDSDGDGRCAEVDNCAEVANETQKDSDYDGIGDACDSCPVDGQNDADQDGLCGNEDNCPDDANEDQLDSDLDGPGDACDPCPTDSSNDPDQDGACEDVDNCPGLANEDQLDTDLDGLGDACDACPEDSSNDADGDGICGAVDTCPDLANEDQTDTDQDGLGDACDVCPEDSSNDVDSDGVCGASDNCPETANEDQLDSDEDGQGDACDSCPFDPNNDADHDAICADVDNCPNSYNRDQADDDNDDIGNDCDLCSNDPFNDADGDLICGDVDNCPTVENPDQEDTDEDGIGDACADEICDGQDNDGNGVIDDGYDDSDQDGTTDCVDPCPLDPEDDKDGDGVCGDVDLCPDNFDQDQADTDSDGIGDLCDTCPADPDNDEDTDAWCADQDNCPTVPNYYQEDEDQDGVGDACEEVSPTPTGDDDTEITGDDDSSSPGDDDTQSGDDDTISDDSPSGDDDVTPGVKVNGSCSCDTRTGGGPTPAHFFNIILALGFFLARRRRHN